MKRFLFVSAILLASCGYDGSYRYSCQDPANWDAKECTPPECKVSGTCTVDVIGFDPTLESLVNPELNDLIPTQETTIP
jgi:hypothetical protein